MSGSSSLSSAPHALAQQWSIEPFLRSPPTPSNIDVEENTSTFTQEDPVSLQPDFTSFSAEEIERISASIKNILETSGYSGPLLEAPLDFKNPALLDNLVRISLEQLLDQSADLQEKAKKITSTGLIIAPQLKKLAQEIACLNKRVKNLELQVEMSKDNKKKERGIKNKKITSIRKKRPLEDNDREGPSTKHAHKGSF